MFDIFSQDEEPLCFATTVIQWHQNNTESCHEQCTHSHMRLNCHTGTKEMNKRQCKNYIVYSSHLVFCNKILMFEWLSSITTILHTKWRKMFLVQPTHTSVKRKSGITTPSVITSTATDHYRQITFQSCGLSHSADCSGVEIADLELTKPTAMMSLAPVKTLMHTFLSSSR